MKKTVKKWAFRVFACLLVVATWLLWYVPDSRMLAYMPSGGTVIRKEVFQSKPYDGIKTAQILYYKDDYEKVNIQIHQILVKRGFKASSNGSKDAYDIIPIGTVYYLPDERLSVAVIKGSYDGKFTCNGSIPEGFRHDGKGTSVFLLQDSDTLVSVVQCFLRGTL